ncbi:MAG: ComEA family DNA-binding protein [Planctomycetota bacterium]|jgi:DNA uptake protein ComE-like DNA-binding protein
MKPNGFAWYQLSRREAALTSGIAVAILVLSVFTIFRSEPDIKLTHQGEVSSLAVVKVNSASVAELMALPGIGERKAQRIVDARKLQKLSSSKDLAEAAGGIPAKEIERMARHISFD